MTSNQADLVAPCGLFCEDCFGFNGRIPDLARDLRKELRACRYDKFADFISKQNFGRDFEDYKACYKVLGAMVKFRCRKGCRQGGGNPFCKIRTCCEKKDYTGCWECTEFMSCQTLDILNPVHANAHRKNIKIIRDRGMESFLKGKHYWYTESKI